MRQLWAPWRMAYIDEDTSQRPGCIFCGKAAEQDDTRNLILSRGKRCFALMNLHPYSNGHLMIAPYEHQPTIVELDSETLTEMMEMAQRYIRALRLAVRAEGFNLGINQGLVAGAGIADHVHLHVTPRWAGDTNFMPVLADVKVMPDFLRSTYEKILAALAELDGDITQSSAQVANQGAPGPERAQVESAETGDAQPAGGEGGEG